MNVIKKKIKVFFFFFILFFWALFFLDVVVFGLGERGETDSSTGKRTGAELVVGGWSSLVCDWRRGRTVNLQFRSLGESIPNSAAAVKVKPSRSRWFGSFFWFDFRFGSLQLLQFGVSCSYFSHFRCYFFSPFFFLKN